MPAICLRSSLRAAKTEWQTELESSSDGVVAFWNWKWQQVCSEEVGILPALSSAYRVLLSNRGAADPGGVCEAAER